MRKSRVERTLGPRDPAVVRDREVDPIVSNDHILAVCRHSDFYLAVTTGIITDPFRETQARTKDREMNGSPKRVNETLTENARK